MRKVFYTPKAKDTLQLVYEFLIENWGQKSANDFLQKADKTIRSIAEQPFIFKASVIDLNVRLATITKQTSLFYEIADDEIILLFFYDNRQEPLF